MMEIRRIVSEDSQELYDPADVEKIASVINELDSADKDQLYVLITKEFRNLLPEEIKKAIIAAAPKADTCLLYPPDATDEVESNFSDDQKYIQDESFARASEESPGKARTFLFTSFNFNKKVKSQLDNDDFFLNIPMLSDKALFNTLRIFSKTNESFDSSNCDDLGYFLRDIQFNPINATRILDYFLFAFCDSLFKLNGGDLIQPKEHPLNYDFLPSKYPFYYQRRSRFEISCNVADRFSYLIGRFLHGGRSVPLILQCLYNEQKGLSFSENHEIPRLSQLDDLRSSATQSRSFSVTEIIFEILAAIKLQNSNTYTSNLIITISNIFDKLIIIPEASSKRPIHPLMALESPKLLKSILNSIISELAKFGKVMRGKKALNSNEEVIHILVKKILKIDNSLMVDLLENSLAAFLENLSDDVEKALEEIYELKKTFDPSAKREEIAEKILQDVLFSKDFNKKTQIFRLIIRDCISLFNSIFEDFVKKRYAAEYKEWATENPDASDSKIKLFNQKFKSLMSSEKSHQINIFKKIICSHEKLNCFLKSSVESVLFLNDSLGGIQEEEQNENIKSLISYYSYGIKALLSIHDFINPDQSIEEETEIPALARLMTREAPEPEPKVNVARLARSYTQINNENIGLSDLYDILVDKACPFILNLIRRSGTRLSKYESVITTLPRTVKINFETKADLLVGLVKKRANIAGFMPDSVYLNPDREELVNYAIQNFMSMKPLEFAMKTFSVTFQNESGIDAGGLTREFLTILVEDIVNPNFGLFEYSSNGNTLQPNPNSHWVPDHLTYFNFLGRLIGKCLADKKPLKVHFARSFLKHILGKTLYIKDLEDIDPILYQNLEWVLENPIEGVLDLTFSTEVVEFGKLTVKDLVPNGRNITVTEANKKDYLKRMCYYKMAESISQQTTALVEGLREIVPITILKLLDEKELSLLISGMPEIDVEDMKANAEVSLGDFSYLTDWIWELLRSFSQKELADFLFFVTGSAIVPVGGFKNFKIKFYQSYSSPESLPIGHTCNLQLDLPKYPSKEKFKEKLLMAINEGTGGFYIG